MFKLNDKLFYLIAALVVALLIIIVIYVDIFENIYHVTRAYENLELDEIIAIVPALAAVLFWYALRWRREARVVKKRKLIPLSQVPLA